jgi:uncharacterized protein (DUF2236 family)
MTSGTQDDAAGMTADERERDLRGLYGPGSEAWRLNREAALLLAAGPRALLLQIAHPLIAEGVDQHSDLRTDPWRRLSATLRSYLTIVYGTTAAARAEIARLDRLHRRVVGPVRDPAAVVATGAISYSGRDPALALWVHATLVDSTMVAYDAWVEPLTDARRAAFYAETRPIALAFGVPEGRLPADVAAFDEYVASMLSANGPVHPTPTARALARAVLHPPLAPLATWAPGRLVSPIGAALRAVPGSLVDWTMWPAVGLLPPGVRTEFGIPWGRRHEVAAAWLAGGIRWWRPRLAPGFRQMTAARAADRRVAGILPAMDDRDARR